MEITDDCQRKAIIFIWKGCSVDDTALCNIDNKA